MGTLEKMPAKWEGERRMFWEEIRALSHTPRHHQAVSSGQGGHVVRLNRLGFYMSGGFPPELRGQMGEEESSYFFRRHVARPGVTRLACARGWW